MSLPDVDWLNHDKAISQAVRGVTEEYLTGPEGNTATPKNFRKVLEWLDALTDEIPVRAYTDDQLARDIGGWKARLAEYGKAQREAEAVDPDAHSSADYGRRVVLPIVLGWYPGAEAQSVADVITPISLAWQTEVSDESMREAWHKFTQDLQTGGLVAGGSIIAAVVTALGLGLGYKLVMSKRSSE